MTRVKDDEAMSAAKVRWGDARHLDLTASSIDVVVTSPPYWRKRDYKVDGQIGQESSPAGYAAAIVKCLVSWEPSLRPTGSVFLNVGDTFENRHLAGIPARIEVDARDAGWTLRNRIVWTKEGGMPEPAKNRLASRHEYILHLTRSDHYFYDLFGYTEAVGTGGNPGDVWPIPLERNMDRHLAPFPAELVRRCLLLCCPTAVCSACGTPRSRIVDRAERLDANRPQAVRAMELAEETRLTPAHIAAIRATGISDAGKATHTQTGTGRNSAEVQRLAAEAKAALGGYFREFTFGPKVTVGWTDCGCGCVFEPGRVLDPFAGTGTTLRVAAEMGRRAVGFDLLAEGLGMTDWAG